MGVSTIDGTIEAAELKRSVRDISIYKSITFRLDDGSKRTITKAVAKKPVADHIVAGNSGRFYAFTGFDLKGVHGVRMSDGTAACEFPTGNAKLFLMCGLIGTALLLLRIFAFGDFSFLGAGLMILGPVGYVLLSKTAREAKAQFDADSGKPLPGPATVPVTT